MLFKLDTRENKIQPIKGIQLKNIGWNENKFQQLLFQNLEKFLQDEELLLIMQSRKWQEEPDLMAIDSKGDLYIFELKAWESQESNVLQVLKYAQIFGQYSYEALNEIYLRFFPASESLLKSLNEKFGVNLTPEEINKKQHLVIITNGLDFQTRKAISYWSNQGIDIRSWIYRVYKIGSEDVLVEFNKFRNREDPFEDIDEGYYIFNTNKANDPLDEEDMLNNHKVAAYFEPWKRLVKKIKKGDKLFLYSSGVGIVAIGLATGKVGIKNYHDDPNYPNEEYFMKLERFRKLRTPLSASEIKRITGINYRFMSTMFSIDKSSGEKLWDYILKNNL